MSCGPCLGRLDGLQEVAGPGGGAALHSQSRALTRPAPLPPGTGEAAAAPASLPRTLHWTRRKGYTALAGRAGGRLGWW